MNIYLDRLWYKLFNFTRTTREPLKAATSSCLFNLSHLVRSLSFIPISQVLTKFLKKYNILVQNREINNTKSVLNII